MTGFVAVIAGVVVLGFLATVRSAPEWRRAVIVRHGRRRSEPKGPGLFFRIPALDRIEWIDLRSVLLRLGERAVTSDGVPVTVVANAYYRVAEPAVAIAYGDHAAATVSVAQATLRSELGRSTLDYLVFERGDVDRILAERLDAATSSWGVRVPLVEIQEVRVPPEMQRAIAARHRSPSRTVSFQAPSSHSTERA